MCKTCREYHKPSPRPIAGMTLATEFNKIVAMDLKMFKGRCILHLIGHVLRLTAGCFLYQSALRK